MKFIEVVAAIIHRDGTYFATQRGYGEFEGMWEFPGGKIEPGEIELKEHKSALWLTTETLNKVEWLPVDKDVIDVLNYYYKNLAL